MSRNREREAPRMLNRRNTVAGVAVLGVVGAMLLGAPPALAADCDGVTFSYTGAVQTCTVSGTGTYTVTVTGAGGGGGGSAGATGGAGAVVTYTLSVTAGQLLTLEVGQGGRAGTSSGEQSAGGGGGGWSAVLDGVTQLVVAGGGGGGGALSAANAAPITVPTGGDAGANGADGEPNPAETVSADGVAQTLQGGQGALASAGGAGGTASATGGSVAVGDTGSSESAGGAGGAAGATAGGTGAQGGSGRNGGAGGTPGTSPSSTGGGGGAGYAGGGGGAAVRGAGQAPRMVAGGGGGGGSSYPASATITTTGLRAAARANGADGSIAFSALSTTPTPAPAPAPTPAPALVTIAFDANGGAGSVTSISGDAGSTATAPSGVPLTRQGYVFVGWNTAKDGSGSWTQPGSSILLSRSMTMYAQWAALAISIAERPGAGRPGSDPTPSPTGVRLCAYDSSVAFAPRSAVLTPGAERTLSALLRKSGKNGHQADVYGFAPEKGRASLAVERARSVQKHLRSLGLRGPLTVRSGVVPSGPDARRATVSVVTPCRPA